MALPRSRRVVSSSVIGPAAKEEDIRVVHTFGNIPSEMTVDHDLLAGLATFKAFLLSTGLLYSIPEVDESNWITHAMNQDSTQLAIITKSPMDKRTGFIVRQVSGVLDAKCNNVRLSLVIAGE